MIGFFKTLIYVVVIIFVGICFFAWHFRVPTTKHLLSTVLNNPVSIQDVDISLSLSRVSGKNVAIRNPIRSQDGAENAIQTRVLELQTHFLNLFRKTLIIEEITLDRVDFFVDMYNLSGSKSNVKTIIGNIHTRAEERFPGGKKHRRPVIVKKITIKEINFSYRNPFLTAGVTHLPLIKNMEINNVGTGHPVSTGQIASVITTTMLRKFASLSGFKNLVETLPQLPFHWIKEIFIKTDHEKPVSLKSFLNYKDALPAESRGIFQKIFSHSKKVQEEDD